MADDASRLQHLTNAHPLSLQTELSARQALVAASPEVQDTFVGDL